MFRTAPSSPPVGGRPARVSRALALVLMLLVGAAALGALAPSAYGAAAGRIAMGGARPASTSGDQSCGRRADPFLRTELFFGSAKPDGSVVTPDEFQRFLDAEITPRFPDGLTLLTGLGQFRGSNGQIARERSMLLILLYPKQDERESSEKIEQIRVAYER